QASREVGESAAADEVGGSGHVIDDPVAALDVGEVELFEAVGLRDRVRTEGAHGLTGAVELHVDPVVEYATAAGRGGAGDRAGGDDRRTEQDRERSPHVPTLQRRI